MEINRWVYCATSPGGELNSSRFPRRKFNRARKRARANALNARTHLDRIGGQRDAGRIVTAVVASSRVDRSFIHACPR